MYQWLKYNKKSVTIMAIGALQQTLCQPLHNRNLRNAIIEIIKK